MGAGAVIGNVLEPVAWLSSHCPSVAVASMECQNQTLLAPPHRCIA